MEDFGVLNLGGHTDEGQQADARLLGAGTHRIA